jgi:hypothetical protein
LPAPPAIEGGLDPQAAAPNNANRETPLRLTFMIPPLVEQGWNAGVPEWNGRVIDADL